MAAELARAIEAIVMVADTPVESRLLAQLLETDVEQVEVTLAELAASYEIEDRGFVLVKVAGGYRFQSHPDLSAYVERFVLEGQSARLSAAALETLAIVAYKQPISRGQVAAIRGVNVDGVVRTLEQRGYIMEVGQDPGPGNPSLFGTTSVFLEKMGLSALSDLPPIADFVPGADVVEQLEQGLRADDAVDTRPDPDLEDAAAPPAAAGPDPEAAGEPPTVFDPGTVSGADAGTGVAAAPAGVAAEPIADPHPEPRRGPDGEPADGAE